MNEPDGDVRYPLGRAKEETERLIRQSRLYDGVTRRLLDEAGIVRGMKVLDIGSGAGDVALLLAERVGPDGNVTGTDVNAAILETARARVKNAGFANVEFTAGDVRTLDLADDFDALVGRMVLMYMSDPAVALKQLTLHLRPRGIVAFEEADLTLYQSLASSDTPLLNTLIEWAVAVFQRSGSHIGMGLDLYGHFVKAGLPDPALHVAAPVGGSETWSGYPYIADTFRSLLPLLEEFGIATAEEVDVETLAERVRRECVAARRPFVLVPHVTAWTTLAT